MGRGELRVYLGAAPGVGKTFAMLNEGRRRSERGTDVVVGFVETHGRAKTAAAAGDLETVPRRRVEYRGTTFEEMDLDALLARRPKVALVDELAHTNVPGSRHEKRWQDIDVLLEAGIDVISTVNIQHLESLNDTVEQITGIVQRETVPDGVVRGAGQVELVDQTPEALRRRMAHGNIYAADKIDAALGNYFRTGNLGALRELALLWLADRVDEALEEYRRVHGIDRPWETRERVVVALTGAPGGEHLIRRAARMAMRAKGELVGVHVSSSDGLVAPSPSDLLDEHRRLLISLGGEYHEAVGSEVAATLVSFARAENATQLVLGATRRSRLNELAGGSIINRVLRHAGAIDVHVISTDAPESAPLRLPARHRRDLLSGRRQATAWLLCLLGLPALTLVLAQLRDEIGLSSVLLLYLCLVVGVAAVGGPLPASAAATGAFLVANWFFTPPIYTWTIGEAENVIALVVFLTVAAVVSGLVNFSLRRSAEAVRARSEASALARSSAELVGDDDPLPSLVDHVRETFGLEGVAVLRPLEAGGWRVEAGAGSPMATRPEDAQATLPLSGDAVLALTGRTLAVDDLQALQAFASQLSSGLERRRLQEGVARAKGLEETNDLRTAILRAVSHDLRTPLASIKASVTSLQQRDVRWTQEATGEFLSTIDEETDRLNTLVGNLLDMSRLETGGLDVRLRAVGLEEVVAGALASLSGRSEGVVVDVPETLPEVHVDAALLERAVANVVSNAIGHSSDHGAVRVEGREVGNRVDLVIADRGPGVAEADRAKVLQPFQRLGDSSNANGVGLGLAVAKGFVEAIGGRLALEDTAGGGLTVVLTLPQA